MSPAKSIFLTKKKKGNFTLIFPFHSLSFFLCLPFFSSSWCSRCLHTYIHSLRTYSRGREVESLFHLGPRLCSTYSHIFVCFWKLWNIFACAEISIRECASSFVVIVWIGYVTRPRAQSERIHNRERKTRYQRKNWKCYEIFIDFDMKNCI